MHHRAIRYGLIDVGCRGRRHQAQLDQLEGVEIAGLADPHDERLDRAFELCCYLDPAPRNDDFEAMVAEQSPEVLLLSLPSEHNLRVLQALRDSPGSIALENPIAHTIENCLAISELAAELKGKLWIGMQYRYKPVLSDLRREFELGVCGDLRMIAMKEHRDPFRVKVGDWPSFSAESGGTLVTKSCHHFDLMNLFAGGRPLRVFASSGHHANHRDEFYDGRPCDMKDNVSVCVDYDNGVRAMLDLGRNRATAPGIPADGTEHGSTAALHGAEAASQAEQYDQQVYGHRVPRSQSSLRQVPSAARLRRAPRPTPTQDTPRPTAATRQNGSVPTYHPQVAAVPRKNVGPGRRSRSCRGPQLGSRTSLGQGLRIMKLATCTKTNGSSSPHGRQFGVDTAAFTI